MIIKIRTKDNLVDLLKEGISHAWRINTGRLKNITNVEIYDFSGKAKIVGTYDHKNTKILKNGRVAVAFKDARIEQADFKWIGQYPIKYEKAEQELELMPDELEEDTLNSSDSNDSSTQENKKKEDAYSRLTEEQKKFIEDGLNSRNFENSFKQEVKQEWLSDKSFMFCVIQKFGGLLAHASEDIKNDPHIVMEAIKNYGHALQYASSELKADKKIVLEAIKNNGSIRHIQAEILEDLDFVKDLCAYIDWKDLLNMIDSKWLTKDQLYSNFLTTKCKEGIVAYFSELEQLNFDENDPREFRRKAINIYYKHIPTNKNHCTCTFTKEGELNFDEYGDLLNYSDEDNLLHDYLNEEFIENIWRPEMEKAIENKNLTNLAIFTKLMTPDDIPYHCKKTTIYGYKKFLELIQNGNSYSVEDLFYLVTNNGEYFSISDYPEIESTLFDLILNSEPSELIASILLEDPENLAWQLSSEQCKSLVDKLNEITTDEEKDNLIEYIEILKEKADDY
jgi:hypothetical protein